LAAGALVEASGTKLLFCVKQSLTSLTVEWLLLQEPQVIVAMMSSWKSCWW